MTERATHDAESGDKLPWQYMPWEALEKVCKVLQYGAQVYSQENWRKGAPYREFAGSVLRHFLAWLQGADLDKKSGHHHLAHCAADVLFILTWVVKGPHELKETRADGLVIYKAMDDRIKQ